MQRGLATRHPGLRARLLVRHAQPDGVDTWLETYMRDAPGGVDAEIEQSIEQAATATLVSLIEGPRHVEAFEPVHG